MTHADGDPTDTVRVGVVGAGAMGAAHVRALATSVPGAVVSEVFDADRVRAEDIAAEVGAAAVPSAATLIASAGVDAVVVAAPDPAHAALTLACLAARRPVLCEKPLAATAAESREIVAAEATLGRRLVQVGFMRRYDPGFVALRERVAAGDVGRVRIVHCVHRNARAHAAATSESLVASSMVHELDLIPWLLGSSLTAITVRAAGVPDGAIREPQLAVLETADGALATVEVFVNAGYGYDIRCEVVGDAGTVRLPDAEVSRNFVDRFADAYRLELRSWVDSVRSGAADGPSAWDGHVANLAAEAGLRSLHTGERVVIVDEPRPDLYRQSAG